MGNNSKPRILSGMEFENCKSDITIILLSDFFKENKTILWTQKQAKMKFLQKIGCHFLLSTIPTKNGELANGRSGIWVDNSDFIGPSVYKGSVYKRRFTISVFSIYS